MPRSWLLSASIAFSGAAYAEAPANVALTPIVVELRLDGRSVETLAWRDASGETYVERAVLDALALQAPAQLTDPIPLSAIAGLTYETDEGQGSMTINCTPQCFQAHEIDGAAQTALVIQRGNGGFFNADMAATASDKSSSVGGLFELGLFSNAGYGGGGMLADSARGEVVRLEAHWTIDLPERRERVRLGDSFMRSSASGAAVRFGGFQYGTDFALDPGFVPLPTPTLRGEAAAPSVVDLFIDGALRMRERVDAGPFSITDAPVLSGGGVAQIVVTDALGRQQVFSQAFYTSPLMLRPGLAEHSISVGFERENFTIKSNDYGRAFAAAFYRRGFSNNFTGEINGEVAEGHTGIGAAASFAHHGAGQFDIAGGVSNSGKDGAFARAGWQRTTRRLSLGLEGEAATANFTRLGESRRAAHARWRASAYASADLGDFGAGSLAYAVTDEGRHTRTETIALSYSPRTVGQTHVFLNALHVRERGSDFTLSIGLSRPLGGAAHVSSRLESDGRRLSAHVSAQRAPDPGGGFGWRADAETGERRRVHGAIAHVSETHESSAELSLSENGHAARVQHATGVAWIGGEALVSRPVRESFALIDIGAANVGVQRDRRPAGVTNSRGRVIITGLRPYEQNRISVDPNTLPWDTQFDDDEILIVPAARSGAFARLPRSDGRAGEITLIASDANHVRAGDFLVRDTDGARFPIGVSGRVYLSGVSARQRFRTRDCEVVVTPQDVANHATLACAA